jgi:hypothetical protein
MIVPPLNQSIALMLKSQSINVYTTDLGEEGIDLGKLYDYDNARDQERVGWEGEQADLAKWRAERTRQNSTDFPRVEPLCLRNVPYSAVTSRPFDRLKAQ